MHRAATIAAALLKRRLDNSGEGGIEAVSESESDQRETASGASALPEARERAVVKLSYTLRALQSITASRVAFHTNLLWQLEGIT